MFAALGAGDLRIGQVVNTVLKQAEPVQLQQELPLLKTGNQFAPKPTDIYIEGVGNLVTQLAQCCQPVPGDDIRGYVTIGRGVSIHRSDCENFMHMQLLEPARVLAVDWGKRPPNLPCGYAGGSVRSHGLAA